MMDMKQFATLLNKKDIPTTNKINMIMKALTKEIKSIIYRVPEILCFTFESYLLGYKYQELTEMAKVALSSIKSQQNNAERLWNFKNRDKRK